MPKWTDDRIHKQEAKQIDRKKERKQRARRGLASIIRPQQWAASFICLSSARTAEVQRIASPRLVGVWNEDAKSQQDSITKAPN